ncbi:MerR family transcriptional regulator [Chelativorans xinjiangense]|uniref:MerR family transcriptional regulator n=1 Tax=Chelativorans xinjiangense TaxID=2681485 RepID=UPI001359C9FC|nr:MerR family transcriptional regulator [Chelativorans xinjiangense]
MRIGEVSMRSGLSVDTLRYYEKLGLIDPPWRADGYRRDYDETVLNWIQFLKALKATGMPLADIETYARLRREGVKTSAERRRMLECQRERVREKIAELTACLNTLDYKIDNYREIEKRPLADIDGHRKNSNGT